MLLLIVTGTLLLVFGPLHGLDPRRLMASGEAMHALVASHPLWTRLAFVGLLTLVVSSGMPGNLLLILAGGMVFGVLQATVLCTCALLMGSLLLFLASRYAFGRGRRPAPELVERLRHGYASHPVNYTLFLRFAPIFPYGAVTVALAWLRCPLGLFLGATALGGSVMLIFETAVGAGLGRAMTQAPDSLVTLLLEPHLLLPLGLLALLSLAPLAFHARLGRTNTNGR